MKRCATTLTRALGLTVLFLVGSLSRTAGAQTTISVTTVNDELSTDGDCSLREAVQTVNQGLAQDACAFGSGPYTISLPAGTYTLSLTGANEDGNATGDLDVVQAVSITGAGEGATILDGNAADRVLHLNPASAASFLVTLSNLTLQNGSVGGVVDGSGLFIQDNTVVITNTTIRNNIGGPNSGTGGIYFNTGSLSIVNSTISGNTADRFSGGGLTIGTGTAAITGSTISGNAAGYQGVGGGIYNAGGSVSITNSTISGNAGNQGGGLYGSGTVTLAHSTVAGNTATTGGGLYQGGGTVTVLSTIVADNSAAGGSPDCAGTIASQDYNLIEDATGCTIDGATAHNVTGVDPMLAPLGDNSGPTFTHLPSLGSPVIDQGNCSFGGVTQDQRGHPRPIDDPRIADASDGCDIGSVELTPAELPVELLSFEAVRDEEQIVLHWATASETNNAGFEVQLRAGEAWQPLAFVEGYGTTTELKRYAYRVDGLAPGTHRFRLKQIDFDGAFTYSADLEVAVEMLAPFVLEPAYPNPFNPQATLRFGVRDAAVVRVLLFNVLGQAVATLYDGTPPAGQMQTLVVDGSRLPSGTYFVRLMGENIAAVQRLLLVK